MTIIEYRGKDPRIHPSVRIAEGARIIGEVHIAAESSVWYNAVIRGDVHTIHIGKRSNIQDGCILHVTRDTHALCIGDFVTIGHAAILHGCTIEDFSLIGMGATILDGAKVQSQAIVAAGAVVPPGMVVRSNTVVAGVPAKMIRSLHEEERAHMQISADRYYSLSCESLKSYALLSADSSS